MTFEIDNDSMVSIINVRYTVFILTLVKRDDGRLGVIVLLTATRRVIAAGRLLSVLYIILMLGVMTTFARCCCEIRRFRVRSVSAGLLFGSRMRFVCCNTRVKLGESLSVYHY